jgi:hypothetical protein
MGLDMNLYRESYVKNWEHNGPDRQHTFDIKLGGVTRKDIKPERISYIVEEVAYWRKFNALHSWFVNECGNGEDNCQKIYLGTEKLEELLKLLKEVKLLLDSSELIIKKSTESWSGKEIEIAEYACSDEVMELFPTQPGFFFGGTDINEIYKSDVEKTIGIIDTLLKEEEKNDGLGFYGGEFYYQASW